MKRKGLVQSEQAHNVKKAGILLLLQEKLN